MSEAESFTGSTTEQLTSAGDLSLQGKISFLFGAGASVEAGIPTSIAMTEKILEILPNISQSKTQWALNFICGAMTAHATAQGKSFRSGLDVEKVFAAVELLSDRREHEATPFVHSWHPAIEQIDLPSEPPFFSLNIQRALDNQISGMLSRMTVNGNRITQSGMRYSTPSDLAGQIEALINARTGTGEGNIYKRLRLEMVSALNTLLNIPGPYAVGYLSPILAVLNRQDVVSVATLNYDRSIEILCEANMVQCETGIKQWSRDRTFPQVSSGIQLIKLHGSIDWRTEEVRAIPGKLSSSTVSVVNDASPNQAPTIVFGQREKLRATGPFLDLLFHWEGSLKDSKSLVVVGYSFRDAHINEVLRRWLNEEIDRRLFVIDPSWSDSDGEFRRELAMSLTPKYHLPNSAPVAPRLRVVTEKASVGLELLLSEMIAQSAVRER